MLGPIPAELEGLVLQFPEFESCRLGLFAEGMLPGPLDFPFGVGAVESDGLPDSGVQGYDGGVGRIVGKAETGKSFASGLVFLLNPPGELPGELAEEISRARGVRSGGFG